MCPEVLNLEDHAKLAINYLLTNTNREANYIPYFGGKIPIKGHPRLEHTGWDYGDGTGRFIEALIYARRMTGNHSGEDIEQGLMKNLFSYFKEDGLSYRSQTPWNGFEADIWAQRGSLLALSLLYKSTNNREIKRYLEKLVQGLRNIAIWDKDICFFGYFWDGTIWVTDSADAGVCFVPIEGLVRCFEVTGNESVLDLATSLAKGMCYKRYFNEDGSFGYSEAGESRKLEAYDVVNGHVHSRTTAILGLIHLGILLGNKDYIEFGKRAYDWLRTQGSKFGWIPENLKTAGKEVSEMCCLVDMIEVQILLAKVGYPEYWDHLQQYVRNHLIEAQFIATSSLIEVIEENLRQEPPEDTQQISYRNVLRRLEGGFAGPIYPDDLFSAYPNSRNIPKEDRLIDISGCCAPSGIKALYLAWDNIVTKDTRGIWINLGISRDTEWAKVTSYSPCEGRLDIDIQKDSPIYIRVPGWVNRKEVKFFVDGKEKAYEWKDGCIFYNQAISGEKLSFCYPLREFSEIETIAGLPYSVYWRGDTVTRLESEETPILPLYKRSQYKQRSDLCRMTV